MTKHDLSVADELSPKLARMRSRNREHARMTRMRKKAQLESLQARQADLKQQAECLEQALTGCQTASILVAMTGCEGSVDAQYASLFLQETMDGNTSESSEGSQEQEEQEEHDDSEGNHSDNPSSPSSPQRQEHQPAGVALEGDAEKREALTAEEVECLRRERNRMHAKRTRDRKKLLVQTLQQNIKTLEKQNRARLDLLTRSLPPHLLETFMQHYNLTLTQ